VRRGWLGLSVVPVGKLGRKEGALVASVTPRSPAFRAGIVPGDILLSVSGAPIRVLHPEEIPLFYQQAADLPIGRAQPIRLIHNGRRVTRRVTVARMEPYLGEEEEHRKLGVTVRGITESLVLARGLPTAMGVLVTGVRAGFPLDTAKPQVAEDDIITSIRGIPVPNVQAFRKVVAGLTDGDVAITFRRGQESWVTVAGVEAPDDPQDNTELPRAWIGIKTQVLTAPIAQALGIPDTTGFRVTEVFPGTEAARSGLRAGDVITALNDAELDASRPQDEEDLRQAVEELAVGEKAKLRILRGKNPGTIGVKLEATPASAPNAKTERQEELEFTVRELTTLDRLERRWTPSQRGVIVSDATAGGWAQMAGLRVDDLIISVQGQRVTGLQGFRRAIASSVARRPRVITLFVQRESVTDFVFIEPDWKALPPK
jgi:serine protease Do